MPLRVLPRMHHNRQPGQMEQLRHKRATCPIDTVGSPQPTLLTVSGGGTGGASEGTRTLAWVSALPETDSVDWELGMMF